MPFSQTDSFETDFGNWTNVTGDQHQWTRSSSSTPSAGTGPSAAHDGSWYLLCETSSPVASLDEFWLESNTINGSLYELDIDFWEHMAGAGMAGPPACFLALEAWKNSTWTEIYRQTGANGATGDGLNWQNKNVVLDDQAGGPYDNSDLKLRFRFKVSGSGNVYENDCSLDLMVITGVDRGSLDQEGYRFRNDDGSETTATWRQSQDTVDEVAKETNIRLRIVVDAAGDPLSTQYQLEYEEVGDTGEQRKIPLT